MQSSIPKHREQYTRLQAGNMVQPSLGLICLQLRMVVS